MKSKLIYVLSVGLFCLVGLSWLEADQGAPWVVPDNYKSMKNMVTADDESIDIGKTLYNQHCKSCHGKEGLGDGPKAAQLDASAGDFTSEEFIAQSDGAMFYKSWIGRDEMPNFEKKIPDKEDMWHVINYMRYLGEQ